MAERLTIAVLDIAASKTGALSVLRDFYEGIKELDRVNTWIFITGVKGLISEDPAYPNIRVIVRDDVKKSKLNRLFFDRFSGASFLKSLRPDIIFSMQNTLPTGVEKIMTPSKKRVRNVIYLHQPLGFQKEKNFSFFNKWEREAALYQKLIAPMIDRSVKRADKIIVQTEWMKEALIKKDRIQPEKVDRITPAVPDLSKLCKPDVKRDPSLFFYPAGSMIYKDHQCIVDALWLLYKRGISDIKVIFTEKEKALPWLRVPSEIRKNIDFRGMVKRENMVPLYQSSVLLFPSYIETFGYPLAEARSLSVPVIAADTPFSRELLSGYEKKAFFPVSSAEALSGLMEESLKGRWHH